MSPAPGLRCLRRGEVLGRRRRWGRGAVEEEEVGRGVMEEEVGVGGLEKRFRTLPHTREAATAVPP